MRHRRAAFRATALAGQGNLPGYFVWCRAEVRAAASAARRGPWVKQARYRSDMGFAQAGARGFVAAASVCAKAARAGLTARFRGIRSARGETPPHRIAASRN